MFSTLFNRRQKQKQPIVTIGVGTISRPHGGKSVLTEQIMRVLLHFGLDSGLYFGVAEPRRLNQLLQQLDDNDCILGKRGRETTLHPDTFRFSLFEGGIEHVRFRLHDTVGQVLTHTPLRGTTEQQSRYLKYMRSLSDQDVLWMFAPCVPDKARAADVRRFKTDIVLHREFVRAALHYRHANRPVSLAVIVNRLDARYEDEHEARERLTKEILPWLTRQLVPFADDKRIGALVIFPVTALGFGTTVESPDSNLFDKKSSLNLDQREWLLKQGRSPKPFNLKPLLLWSVMNGLLHQEVDATPD